MATIQFENGTKVRFDGTPTQADVEEIAGRLNLRAPQQAAPTAEEPQKKKRGFLGSVASFLAPTAVKTFEKIRSGEGVGVRDVLGSALEVGSFFIPGGAAVKGATTAARVAKGAAAAARAAKAAKTATTLGRTAARAAKFGAATGATAEAGRAVGEGEDIGGVAARTLKGAALGAATGAAVPVIGRTVFGKKAAPTEAVRRVFQPQKAGEQAFVERTAPSILSKVETEGVKTYGDLSRAIQSSIDKGLKEVDEALLSGSSTPIPLSKLGVSAEVKAASGRTVKTTQNFVEEALGDLRELYTRTRNQTAALRVKALQNKAKGRGLTPFEINQLAREYGTTFKQKAFNKRGDPLTSVAAETFENTRKGVKQTARMLLPEEKLKQMDRDVTDLIRLKGFSDRMQEKVTNLEQKVVERGLFEKAFRGLAGAVDIATFGGPKAFVHKLFFPSNVGLKTLNSIDLQNQLAKNLQLLKKLEGAPDSAVVSALRNLAKKAGIVTVSTTNFGTRKDENE